MLQNSSEFTTSFVILLCTVAQFYSFRKETFILSYLGHQVTILAENVF